MTRKWRIRSGGILFFPLYGAGHWFNKDIYLIKSDCFSVFVTSLIITDALSESILGPEKVFRKKL